MWCSVGAHIGTTHETVKLKVRLGKGWLEGSPSVCQALMTLYLLVTMQPGTRGNTQWCTTQRGTQQEKNWGVCCLRHLKYLWSIIIMLYNNLSAHVYNLYFYHTCPHSRKWGLLLVREGLVIQQGLGDWQWWHWVRKTLVTPGCQCC